MIPQRKEICLVLYNIRSVYNAGAIFRTADAIGVSKIYLCGYTPHPTDRFGRERKDFAKSALGAEKIIPWEHIKDIKKLLKDKKGEGFKIFALEQDEKSINYKKAKASKKNIIILGNEVEGINKNILEICDCIIEIPMSGKKESLNVSVATGIALFSLFG